MKIILLTSNSIQNKALAHMLNEQYELIGIVCENRFSSSNRLFNFLKKVDYNPIELLNKIYQKWKLKTTDIGLVNYLNKKYGAYDEFPDVPFLEVDNINNNLTQAFIKDHSCDLLVVSGTHIVKRPVLRLAPQLGIINMHTGLSPYYNGGPSCTFWCLYNEDISKIGATVMFIDEGIDSGNIILNDVVQVEQNDIHASLEFKAIDLGNKLILKSIEKLKMDPGFKGVPQSTIGKGYLYFNKDFTFEKRLDLQKRLKQGLISRLLDKDSGNKEEIKLVK